MKKIAIIMFFGTILSPLILQCNNETVQSNLNLFESITGMKHVTNTTGDAIFSAKSVTTLRFYGLIAIIIGSGALWLGAKRLCQDVKALWNLWKRKFENNENVTINWRLIPRHVILSVLAIPATLYGFAITTMGLGAIFHASKYRELS